MKKEALMKDSHAKNEIVKHKRSAKDIYIFKKRRTILYKKYGHLIGQPTKDLPSEHTAKVGGLRCFRNKWQVIHGKKDRDLPKVRCGQTAARGSLFCKRHGGANSKALTNGNQATRLFKSAYRGELVEVFQAFLCDENIMDHKRELATLRTVLLNYIDSLCNKDKDMANINTCMDQINEIMGNGDYGDADRFFYIKQIMDAQQTLTDGTVIDRIAKLVENIGKSIERIDRLEKSSDYMLTPEGMKIMLRSIVEIITRIIDNEDTIRAIKQGFASISVATGGDVSKLNQDREPITVSASTVIQNINDTAGV